MIDVRQYRFTYRELFLLGHADDGSELIHRSSLSAGLAGAAITDLWLLGRVGLLHNGTHLALIRDWLTGKHRPTADPVMDGIMALLDQRERTAQAPGELMATVHDLTQEIYNHTARYLVQTRIVRHETSRRFMRAVSRFPVVDTSALGALRGEMYYAINNGTVNNTAAIVHCGLLRALQMEPTLNVRLSRADLTAALTRVLDAHATPEFLAILACVESMVANTANAAYG